ncbi:MAG: flagellar hook-associated protein FlgK [Salinisphaeraceae bacterium]
MPDLLGIGTSALNAYKRALDTTGHNISNAATPGYTRQQTGFVSQVPAGTGVGSGVRTTGVERLLSEAINQRLTFDAATLGRLETLETSARRIDRLHSDSGIGLASDLDAFFNSLSQLASDPASGAVRSEVLGYAESLVAGFNRAGGELARLGAEVETGLVQAVADVNQLARDIADINDSIVRARGSSGGQPPNDLLDQRDRLINELAGLVDVRTVDADDGSRNVFIAGGQPLVLGTQANRLALQADPYQAERSRLVFDAGGQGLPVGDQISGGRVAGLLGSRTTLDAEAGRLGRLAAAVSLSINAANAGGVDAAGQPGGNIFTVPVVDVRGHADNGGSADVAVGYADVGDLTGRGYVLSFDGSGWQVADAITGAGVAVTGTGTLADPLLADGLSLTISGSPAAGDRFLVRPTQDAAADMGVALTDTTGIAAAGRLRVAADTGNPGSATGSISVLDAADAALDAPVTISFTSDTEYTVGGAGPFTYDAATGITASGWRVMFDGAPEAGDVFNVGPTGANSGDNRNALALAAVGNAPLLAGGTRTLSAENAEMIGAAGNRARQLGRQTEAATAVNQQNVAEREAVSGVNLDEEAADLLRFQQAYQAAARIIAVADETFQTLLAAVGR